MERDSCGSCSTLFGSQSDTIVVGCLWEFHTILQYVDPHCCWPIAYMFRQADWMACHEEQEWKWKVRKFDALSSKVPPGAMHSKRLLRCVLLFPGFCSILLRECHRQNIFWNLNKRWQVHQHCNNWVHPAGGYGSVGYCLLNYFSWSICSKLYDP